ncbi:MAG: hypothetical protein CO095_03045 [Armatimonadetes bacterium CG_4_9_14_3_um_filter_58_7]|nr:MAG: hypothetical protein CO095_03045 [Armatimonadetes bacterium CG_4_9_14_3_um_filter_58_7]
MPSTKLSGIVVGLIAMNTTGNPLAKQVRVDVNAMPRVVFTGDSQTCGRVGAMDYPQMLSWEMPARVINTAVGGTNTTQLLHEMTGGIASVIRGERAIRGTNVPWHAGPYPGQYVRVGKHEYIIDRIEAVDYAQRASNLWITEPAKEDFEGTDYAIEAGWRVRIAEQRPDYACFMYSVNDSGKTSEQFVADLEEILRRTRDIGAQPLFLSGVPYMDSNKGGSHPGGNQRVAVRAFDLAKFCARYWLPFGDVFSVLMALDETSTSVWRDTVHPTTDGSITAIKALRHLFRDLGVLDNPYYVRGYRASQRLRTPGTVMSPLSTSQPDYNAKNEPRENEFDLAAIRVRDEYALIDAADGNMLHADTPLVLQFGVGSPAQLSAAQMELVVGNPTRVSIFDWGKKKWRKVADGSGRLSLSLSSDSLRQADHAGALWVALTGGREGVALDYAAVVLEGNLKAFRSRAAEQPVAWPDPRDLRWPVDGENLIANGDFSLAEGGCPAHWQRRNRNAVYLPAGVVVAGTGDFVEEKRVHQFRTSGKRPMSGVRPLDMLRIADGPEDARGSFLIAEVIDQQAVRVRRFPQQPHAALGFEIVRSSGCGVVPSGCLVECRKGSGWQTTVSDVQPGRYVLGFFYRAFDPMKMDAEHAPGRIVTVNVRMEGNQQLLNAKSLVTSFQWQRAWVHFDVPEVGTPRLRLTGNSATPVQFTGVSLQRASSVADTAGL